jgi:hypothetical protein
VVKFKVYVDRAPVQEMAAFAGLTGLTIRNGQVAFQTGEDPMLFWYDPPDVRFGRSLMGLMQIVVSDGDKLYYRSFTNSEAGNFTKESSGQLTPGADYVSLFKRMNGRIRASEFLPSAMSQPHYVAASVTPGKETDSDKERYQPALQCRLTDGKDSTPFWLSFGQRKTVDCGSRRFAITLQSKVMKLGFELKLQRALTTVDPGTRAPATYSSWVQLFDPAKGVDGERRLITMNEPLEHRGYKFYQSQLEPLRVDDSNGRPVNLSVFTVGYDPGLGIKYLGSLCLASGIFMMFYMRAYFFKARKRVTETPATPAPPASSDLNASSVAVT